MATIWANVCIIFKGSLASLIVLSMIGIERSSASDDDSPALRGKIVSVEQLEELTIDEVGSELKAYGIPGKPEFGVVRYRLQYQTVDFNGNLTIASGALVVPVQAQKALPLLSFQHGTTVARERAPSHQSIDLIGMGLGTSGYVTAFPDYLGLGKNDGLHPYVHAGSLASAIVDFLRAVRSFCSEMGIPLNHQLFLMGYSEGGYATMAAHRAIQSDYASEFTVTASAPMAGPYNLSEVMMQAILDKQPYPSPMYLPFTLLSYNQIYSFYDDHHEVFRPEYANLIDSLFNGELNLHDINAHLPEIPLEILREDFVADLKSNKGHPLRKALEENDLHSWTPNTPLRMIHCKGDDQVSFKNAEMALKGFAMNGSHKAELVALDYGNHEECAPPSILLAKMWFDQFKMDTECPIPSKDCQVMTTENRTASSLDD